MSDHLESFDSEISDFPEPRQEAAPATKPSWLKQIGALLRDSVHCLWFREPRWGDIPALPWLILLLYVLEQGLMILVEWLMSSGPQKFFWFTFLQNGAYFLAICWLVYYSQSSAQESKRSRQGQILCLILLLYMLASMLSGLVYGVSQVLLRFEVQQSLTAQWIVWGVQFTWMRLAELILLWHASSRNKLHFFFAASIFAGLSLLALSDETLEFWYPVNEEQTENDRPSLVLTQEVMEAQPQLLADKLTAIAPQRAGVVDLYTITFAPEADEDVFRREAGMVSSVMAQRFDAAGRGIELINHVETLGQWPWATPLNLRRSITAIAGKMDQNEDILFVYLTSHGGQDGQLAAGFWPMQVDSVTPQQLKRWLDEAGVRHRVIAVSACYSGSWIAPLASADTLVLTAADADNTSYGCGRKSELTFFGRAMFDEQLRSKTRSFEAAHHSARELIRQREVAAGKDDGYSNPQISMGANIRVKLAQLEARFKP